jgi:hypothetical protein
MVHVDGSPGSLERSLGRPAAGVLLRFGRFGEAVVVRLSGAGVAAGFRLSGEPVSPRRLSCMRSSIGRDGRAVVRGLDWRGGRGA